MTDILNEMSIVTNEMPADTVEFQVDGSNQQLSGQPFSADIPQLDSDAHSHEETIPMDDGTPLTYTVFPFASDDVEPASEADSKKEEAEAEAPDASTAPSAEPPTVDEPVSSDATPSADAAASGDALAPETEHLPAADPSSLASMVIPAAHMYLATTGNDASEETVDAKPEPAPKPLSAQDDVPDGFDYLSFQSGQATVELPAPSVLALGAQGGIRPSSDVALFENVFGDQRVNLQFEPIGPDAFNIPSFSLNSTGDFMYWPQSRDQDRECRKPRGPRLSPIAVFSASGRGGFANRSCRVYSAIRSGRQPGHTIPGRCRVGGRPASGQHLGEVARAVDEALDLYGIIRDHVENHVVTHRELTGRQRSILEIDAYPL